MLIKTEAKNGPDYSIRKLDDYDRRSFTKDFAEFEKQHKKSRVWVEVPSYMVGDPINRMNFRFFIKK